MREIRWTVTKEDQGKTAEQVFRLRMGITRSMLSRLKFHQGLFLDGEQVHTDARVRLGQVLTAVFRDEKPAWQGLVPSDVRFGIAYEDQDILVVDKPAPLPSIASAAQRGDTLEGAVYRYFKMPEHFVYRPVNRLDKGTSGLMVIAKNAFSQAAMQKELHRDFTRTYLAVTEGVPKEKEGSIAQPIRKAEASGVRRICAPDGKAARTDYKVIKTGGGRALLELLLHTGRTHQIRVHLAFIGCPITGDYLYGTEHPALNGRFALHSHTVAFRHPMTGEMMRFTSPLPKELSRLLKTEDGQRT